MSYNHTYTFSEWQEQTKDESPLECPACGTEHITGGDFELQGHTMIMRCSQCQCAIGRAIFAEPFHFGDPPLIVSY